MDTRLAPMMPQMTSASSSYPLITSQNSSSSGHPTPSPYQQLFDAARLYLKQTTTPQPLRPLQPLSPLIPRIRKRATPPASPSKERPEKEQRTQSNSTSSDEVTSSPILYRPILSHPTTEWIITEKILHKMGAQSANIEQMAIDRSYGKWISGYHAMANFFLTKTAHVRQEDIVSATAKGVDSYLCLANEHLKKRTTYLNSKPTFAKGPDGEKRAVRQLMAPLPPMTNAQLKCLFMVAANQLTISNSSLIPLSLRINAKDIHILACSHHEKISLMLWTGTHESKLVPPEYLLGKGGFSVAQKAIDFANGTCLALRTSRCDVSQNHQTHAVADLKRELRLLQQLRIDLGPVDGLPEAPRFFWIAEEKLRYGMLDSMYEGNLSKVEFTSIQPTTGKIQFLRQVAKVIRVVSLMNYASSIAHGDIKRQNILFRCVEDEGRLRYDLRLTDFGHSRHYSDMLHRENSFPALYTPGYFIEREFYALYNRATRYLEDAVASTLRQMEMYAIGITLKKVVTPCYDESPKSLRDRATTEGLDKEFYMKLKGLIKRMTVRNPKNRLPLNQAAPALNEILDQAMPTTHLSPIISSA